MFFNTPQSNTRELMTPNRKKYPTWRAFEGRWILIKTFAGILSRCLTVMCSLGVPYKTQRWREWSDLRLQMRLADRFYSVQNKPSMDVFATSGVLNTEGGISWPKGVLGKAVAAKTSISFSGRPQNPQLKCWRLAVDPWAMAISRLLSFRLSQLDWSSAAPDTSTSVLH